MSNQLVLNAKVEELGEKCAQFVDSNGVDSPDLLIEYGRALFALAKSTAGFLDSQKVDEKQLPMENPQVKVAGEESEESSASEEPSAENNEEDSPEVTNDNQHSEEVTNTPLKVSNEPEINGQDEDNDEESESENEDDFVAAFSVVDGARVLLEKVLTQSEDCQPILEKLAQARELLGDISLEDDNAGQAVEDYIAAIDLRHRLNGDHSAAISAAEFSLAMAYDAISQPESALIHLRTAAEVATQAGLPTAAALTQRHADLKTEIAIAKKTNQSAEKLAKKTTAESISGRTALGAAVQSMVANATDISQLTRKRKRPQE